MQRHHVSRKTLITGQSGTGKTTHYLDQIASSRYDAYFIFDHEGEFAAHAGRPSALSSGDLLAQFNARRFVVYDPMDGFPGDLEAGFAFFCEWSFEMAGTIQGKKVFCCDELQKLVGTNQISWELALVLETGRRRGLDFLAIAQSANLVHNRIRNMLTEIVAFRQIDRRALEFLEDVGFEAEQVRSLDKGHYITLDVSAGELRKGEAKR